MNPINKLRFKDKVVFISGGTSGIGLATAVQFALEGATHIIICGRRESKWIEAQKYIEEKLSREQKNGIQYWPCDVRVESQVKKTIEQIFIKFGRTDLPVSIINTSSRNGVLPDSHRPLYASIKHSY